MKKITKILGYTVTAGFFCLTATEVLKYIEGQKTGCHMADFNQLVKEQKTVDYLDAGVIAEWAEECQGSFGKDMDYILAYPTPEVISRYRLSGFPENTDTKHIMLFLAVEKKRCRPAQLQMVCYGKADQELLDKMFAGGDYAVVEG